MATIEQRRESRIIDVIGTRLALQGTDAHGILKACGSDLSPENIVAQAERFGYSIQTAEAFAQAIIDSEVLWTDDSWEDAPPADDRDETAQDVASDNGMPEAPDEDEDPSLASL